MRHIFFGIVLVLAACGGSSEFTAPPAQPGRLVFEMDPASCTMFAGSATNVVLLVSSVPVDTLNMAAGDTASFSVSAGLHLVGAHESQSKGMEWASTLVTVPSGGNYRWLMKC